MFIFLSIQQQLRKVAVSAAIVVVAFFCFLQLFPEAVLAQILQEIGAEIKILSFWVFSEYDKLSKARTEFGKKQFLGAFQKGFSGRFSIFSVMDRIG